MRPSQIRIPHLPSWAIRVLERLAREQDRNLGAIVRDILCKYLAPYRREED